MRHTKEVTKTYTSTETVKVTCDLCGERIVNIAYDVDDVTIERDLGTRYPEGSHGSTFRVDMCGKCFETKLVPWLSSLTPNVVVQEEVWDL